MGRFEYVVLFICMWSISLIKCDPDSVDYCKKDAMHSCCKRKDAEEGTGCHTMLDGMSEFRKSLLKKHNELRAKTANGNTPNSPKASNMNALSYNLDLEYTAWCNAATCTFEHEKKGTRRATEGFRAAGQNLAIQASTIKPRKTYIDDIEAWYKESDDVTADIIKKYPQQLPKMVGHYTQLVTGCVTHVGCARSTWNSTKRGKEFINELLTCNYGSTDPECHMNLIGGAAYTAGDPCTACPKDRPCSVKYPGLCGEEVEVNSEWKPPLTIYKLIGEEKSGGGGGGGVSGGGQGQGGGGQAGGGEKGDGKGKGKGNSKEQGSDGDYGESYEDNDTNNSIRNSEGGAYNPKSNNNIVFFHLILALAALQLFF